MSWVNVKVAGYAPIMAVVLLAPALVVFMSPGDWRISLSPWFFAAIPTCLAMTCLGLIRVHQKRWVTIGAGWTALALLGLGAFPLAVGIGGLTGLQDLTDEQLGLLAWLPIIAWSFGFASLTPALVVTAISTGMAQVLPRWGVWALWFISPLLLITFIVGGTTPDSIAEPSVPIGLILIMFGWIVIGQSLLKVPKAQTPHTKNDTYERSVF